MTRAPKGPLAGLRVLEFEALGPGPFCGMMLADMGADVLLVDRPRDAGRGEDSTRAKDLMFRGRRSITLDLKTEQGAQAARQLASRAEVLIEGFRPGVLERLGLAPELLLTANPALVIGRMTGWGQHGPLADKAGHDINYIAMAGALHAIGRAGEAPQPPLNFVGDFGGGGMMLAFGLVCAVLQARGSGRGQVVDAAMVDGAGLLSTMFAGYMAQGRWREERGVNTLDGGAPWYCCYQTADGKYMAVGAIEAKFYQALLQGLALDPRELPDQHDRAAWPQLRARFAAAFARKSRAQWEAIFAELDACVTPVLTWTEGREHALGQERGSWITIDGIPQPAPAPRFSQTPGQVQGPPPQRGQGAAQALVEWGFDAQQCSAILGV